MSWSTALNDLRSLLADNQQNRLCHRKKVFGDINGSNRIYKTFEPRRITNFQSAPLAPLGVFLGPDLQLVTIDDVTSGEFELQVAPTDNGNALTATYYYQWFLDEELLGFLKNASNWLLIGDDFTNVPPGLTPPALQYAASDALRFLAMRWAERSSTAFLLEDAPKKESLGLSDTYMKLADSYMKQANNTRDSFYKRSGQALAPSFGSKWGTVGGVTPRR